MNYTYHPIDEQTGRIVFETRHPYNSKNKPLVATMNSHAYKDGFLARGLSIGAEKGLHHAMLIFVERRDVIVVHEMAPGRRAFTRTYFRVEDNFQPQNLNLPDRELTSTEWLKLVEDQERVEFNQDLANVRLRNFMSDGSHPYWLARCVGRQVAQWRAHNPEALLRFAPGSLREGEILEWVQNAPALALEHLKERLSQSQLAQCVSDCPDAAIQFAFEHLTTSQLADAVIKTPKILLEHAADKVTHDVLRQCADAAPCAAFFARVKMPPAEKSILLARSYKHCWQAKFGIAEIDMHEELLDSMFDYPDEWLLTHHHSCALILKNLSHYHKLVFLPEHLLRLVEVMPSQRGYLVKALAPSV